MSHRANVNTAYAAAFFLLADNLAAAVDVCLHQLKDLQLAVAISRVYEGDHGPVLHKVLHDDILPLAAQGGNRWLASWAFWMLGRKDMAVRSLIVSVSTATTVLTPADLCFRHRYTLFWKRRARPTSSLVCSLQTILRSLCCTRNSDNGLYRLCEEHRR